MEVAGDEPASGSGGVVGSGGLGVFAGPPGEDVDWPGTSSSENEDEEPEPALLGPLLVDPCLAHLHTLDDLGITPIMGEFLGWPRLACRSWWMASWPLAVAVWQPFGTVAAAATLAGAATSAAAAEPLQYQQRQQHQQQQQQRQQQQQQLQWQQWW